MEAAVAMDLIVAVHDKMDSRVYCETLVSDDDSTMRSHLQHSENGGKLDNSIPQPDFLADPSHRIKVMAGSIFKLVKDTKNPHECKNIDAMRVKNTSVATFTKIESYHWMSLCVGQELLLNTCLTVMSGAIRSDVGQRI